MKLKIIIGDQDPSVVSQLREGIAGFSFITPLVLSPEGIRRYPGLDAEYVSLPAAERWGSKPLIHGVQILNTSSTERAEGFPPYIITGVAMNADDPRDPRFELKLWITALMNAIAAFNEISNNPITTVGVWTEWIGIKRIDLREASQILKREYSAIEKD